MTINYRLISGGYYGEHTRRPLHARQRRWVWCGGTSNLSTDNTFLFWLDDGRVLRLANDAAALPKINLHPTGLEITQGIQRADNSVVLVQNRDTYVRAFVAGRRPVSARCDCLSLRVMDRRRKCRTALSREQPHHCSNLTR